MQDTYKAAREKAVICSWHNVYLLPKFEFPKNFPWFILYGTKPFFSLIANVLDIYEEGEIISATVQFNTHV